MIAHAAASSNGKLHISSGDGVGAAERSDSLWLDLSDPSEDEIEWLRQEYDLHPMAVRDIRRHHQRPKLDTYGDTCFAVLYAIRQQDQELDTDELQLVWTRNHLVSIHWKPIAAIDDLAHRLSGGLLTPVVGQELCTADIAYALIDTVLDGYFPALDFIAERSEDIEEEMFSSRRGPSTLQALFELKKSLFHARKVIAPARDVINVLLRRDHQLFAEQFYPYFQDLYDRSNRVIDGMDTYRDLLSTALDTYLSFVSNDVNQTVKRMTAVTAILMVDALIAGIYGMNFAVMPELQWPLGYPYALALMALSSLALWALFRRIRWF